MTNLAENHFAPVAAGNAQKIDILALAERIFAVLLSALVLFFLFIRATHAGALWRDEAAALQLAQMPTVSEICSNFQRESFPLPFPLTIRGYVALFGASDTALRWFGFIVGGALLTVSWLNARRIGDSGPLLFLALFGLNAAFLTWGTSLRGYGLGCVLLLLSLGLAAKAIQQPNRSNAIIATIAAIAPVQYMLNAVPLIGAIAASAVVVFVVRRQFRKAGVVCICGALCAISFVPYLKSYLAADWNVVMKFPTNFFSLWEKFRLALEERSPSAALFWYIAVPLVIFTAIWLLWISRHLKTTADSDSLLFLVVAVVLSAVAYYAFLRILSYATRPWYYLPLLCAVAGAIDLIGGFARRLTWLRIARLVLAVAAVLLLPFTLWNTVRERLTDIDVVAHKLEQEAGPDDLIVLNPWYFGPSFYRYYHGQTRWITVPTMSEHRIHRYDLMKSKMMELDPLSDVRSAIRQTLQSSARVWIVGGARPPEHGMPASLGPAPNPYFGWLGYMSFWSIELGSFLNQHTGSGEVALEPMAGVSNGENVPLLVASGWRD